MVTGYLKDEYGEVIIPKNKDGKTIFDHDRFKNPTPQSFSLPLGIITHWLTASSSAVGLQKLQQTCKYFYSKLKVQFYDEYDYLFDDGYLKTNFELEDELSGISYWITDRLSIKIGNEYEEDQGPISFPNWQIYRCTITTLYLTYTKLTFEDFQFITKENTIKNLGLVNNPIFYKNGSLVPLEALLTCLPNVERMNYLNGKYYQFSSSSLKALKKVKLWNKLQMFNAYINCPSDDFQPQLLLDFIKLNAAPSSKWYLRIECPDHMDKAKKCIRPWLNSWTANKPNIYYC